MIEKYLYYFILIPVVVFLQRGCNFAETNQALVIESMDNCDWRICEIYSETKACSFEDSLCDMHRNLCVAKCANLDCCAGVQCPEGTICVPNLGVCGIPVGLNCFDMGSEWWTGRDIISNRSNAELERPQVTTFQLINSTSRPLYFEGVFGKFIRFDLYFEDCNSIHKLELSENHYCPTPCPAEGKIIEFDCGEPPSVFWIVAPGKTIPVNWQGMEEVGNWRICDGRTYKYCQAKRKTIPGTFSVELCGYLEIKGGQMQDNKVIGSEPTGQKRCQKISFDYPVQNTVKVVF